MQSGKVLSYEEYCSLLLLAAQQHDMHCGFKPDKAMKRRIYKHNINSDFSNGEFYDTGTYDIDQPNDTVQVNATSFQGPRLAYDQWKALPEDAKKIWDMLSQEVKAIILWPPPKPNPNRATKPFTRPSPSQQKPPTIVQKQIPKRYEQYQVRE